MLAEWLPNGRLASDASLPPRAPPGLRHVGEAGRRSRSAQGPAGLADRATRLRRRRCAASGHHVVVRRVAPAPFVDARSRDSEGAPLLRRVRRPRTDTRRHPRYHRWFPRADRAIAGEWTPAYAYEPWVVPMIARAAPEARIILLLRDPIDRFRSGVEFGLTRGYTHNRSVIEAFHRGLYAGQVARLFAHVPRGARPGAALRGAACRPVDAAPAHGRVHRDGPGSVPRPDRGGRADPNARTVTTAPRTASCSRRSAPATATTSNSCVRTCRSSIFGLWRTLHGR